MSDVEDVIIIGSGPAGYTAALYTARANLQPLVLEGFAWGGLLQQTTDVENYPGFPEGVMGPEMMQKFRDQAERFGARLETEEAERVELADEPGAIHRVWVGDQEYSPAHVIWRWEPSTRSSACAWRGGALRPGVSYCATCDAAFFRDAATLIVGGGDSAMEEAIFLSKFASKVSIVHRRPEFRASKIMLERARAQENIDFLTPYRVSEFLPGESGALGSRHARQHRDRRGARARGVRSVHRDRPRAAVGLVAARSTSTRGLRDTAGTLDAHQPPGRVRRRRPRRPHLPPGDHRSRLRL